ncbi:hypothetical protein ES705_28281 [subsurface metagenome]
MTRWMCKGKYVHCVTLYLPFHICIKMKGSYNSLLIIVLCIYTLTILTLIKYSGIIILTILGGES